ncbi:hypothetical protein BR63_07270 [Thermanaerosceptrum fracticalcis]|uniref:Uncharacterized protein n=1 Tax=Thermanaerosceptrum fracticalcis TaxID=1712410 RepID=A0A7G6E225_THEFR|nr:hypothetical protein [Thermanaerosceptrum fracticalcis]QNB46129.1 hypothetical protein BR63_07270 [Thermanaerosceptrum fracticalcis]
MEQEYFSQKGILKVTTAFRNMLIKLSAGTAVNRKANHPEHKRELMAWQLNPVTLPLVS